MNDHPIDSLVDHLTVDDIMIDLLDNPSFKSTTFIAHHIQQSLYDNKDFSDISKQILSQSEIRYLPLTSLDPEIKRIAVCELDKSCFQDRYNFTSDDDIFKPMNLRIVTKNYSIKKTPMMSVIRLNFGNKTFTSKSGRMDYLLLNVEFSETIDRISDYLKKDFLGIFYLDIPEKNSVVATILFNSYSHKELTHMI